MKELRCPHCQRTFTVDESEYADLLNQVRNESFNEELNRRIAEIERTKTAERTAILARKEQELTLKHQQELQQKNAEIERLKAAAANADTRQQLAVAQTQQALREKIQELKDRALKAIQEREQKIANLENKAQLEAQRMQINEQNLINQHQRELQMKDEEIARYKDFKARLSTKGVGESLEVFCNNQFETMVHPFLPSAQFGKDNEVVEGTKGDFVFRDYVDGVESVSIMFEMKNEADSTDRKHKNADFFDKLDKDRAKKKCEYAVLVTMLELDNDLYNNGIYAVPQYNKMYVVRPQQFLTIISLLVQMGRNTIDIKQQLAEARDKEVDVTHFEEKLAKVKSVFGTHVKDAASRYYDALADIDKAINQLNKMKTDLQLWLDHLYKADKNLEELTIRSLTYNNPTMKAKFIEARKNNAEVSIDENETIDVEEIN